MPLVLAIGIVDEMTQVENRVALVPEDAKKLVSKNVRVLVQRGTGRGTGILDSDYSSTGCELVEDRKEVIESSDIILMLGRPDDSDLPYLKVGKIVVGQIFPLRFPDLINRLAERDVTVISLELLPRTTRAQSMDVLSSQAAIVGYRAAIVGAFHSQRLMPMLTTAAGTVKPANVLVIGAGVAGLMAIATAKRLGASVRAYDVRKAAGDDVRSLGAKFLDVGIDATGTGGYARQLTDEEKDKEKAMLEEAIIASDFIITTAGVPGKKAPLIISRKTVERMRPASIIVDAMADSGGNCEVTQPGKTLEINSVKIIGLVNPSSDYPINASQMYSRNMQSFLSVLIGPSGNLIDLESDELIKASTVCRSGQVTFPPLIKEDK